MTTETEPMVLVTLISCPECGVTHNAQTSLIWNWYPMRPSVLRDLIAKPIWWCAEDEGGCGAEYIRPLVATEPVR